MNHVSVLGDTINHASERNRFVDITYTGRCSQFSYLYKQSHFSKEAPYDNEEMSLAKRPSLSGLADSTLPCHRITTKHA